MRVVTESLDLVNNSKNPRTRMDRLDVAINKLSYLRSRFPHREDISIALTKSFNYRPQLHTTLLQDSIEKCMDKSRMAKTLSGKVNSANKALEILRDAVNDEYVDKTMLKQTIIFIKTYINKAELEDIEVKAERYEFKENYKKALDLYQDALFFLKKDEIDDAQQKEDFKRINNKIEKMRTLINGNPIETSAETTKPPQNKAGIKNSGRTVAFEKTLGA